MKRRWRRLAIIALAVTIFMACQATAFAADDYVKVGLRYDSSAQASVTLSCPQGFTLGTLDSGTYEELLPLPGYSDLTVTVEGGAVAVKSGETLLSADIGKNGCIMPVGETIKINGTPYRGGAFFSVNSGSTLNVINYIKLDDYVKGVLNAELNHGNPMEALKAQAVAARSFGAYNYGRHGTSGFDLCGSTHCQVYAGYSAEYPETNAAVENTAGLAIYYEGKPVVGYYYKNSGGHTQSSIDVWNSNNGYLSAVKDAYSPSYPWESSFTFSDIEKKLSAAGKSVGTLQKVEITKRNGSGAVETLTFAGSGGTATLEKEKIRTAFGYSVIKSTMFSFSDSVTAGGGNQAPSGDMNIFNGGKIKSSDSVSVIGANGTVTQIKGSDLYVSDGKQQIKMGSGTVSSSEQESGEKETVTQSPVVFKGYGYGHGIGMPQDSAVEMAKKGFSFEEILKYYYTGIELR